MNAEIKAEWVADLRSGRYQQGRGALNRDGRFCCLGVLCEQAVRKGVIPAPTKKTAGYGTVAYYGEGLNAQASVLPDVVAEWAGIRTATKIDNTGIYTDESGKLRGLYEDNDLLKQPFTAIANSIEKYF